MAKTTKAAQKTAAAPPQANSESVGDDLEDDREDEGELPDDHEVETDEEEHTEGSHTQIHTSQDMAVRQFGDAHMDAQKEWLAPSDQLIAPPPRRGFVQRWIRYSIKNEGDGSNIASQRRQGWYPRRMSTVPKAERHRFATARFGKIGEVISTKDLILCEMPEHIAVQRSDYYEQKRLGQSQALLDQHIGQYNKNLPRTRGLGPVHVEEHTTERVGRRRPVVAGNSANR